MPAEPAPAQPPVEAGAVRHRTAPGICEPARYSHRRSVRPRPAHAAPSAPRRRTSTCRHRHWGPGRSCGDQATRLMEAGYDRADTDRCGPGRWLLRLQEEPALDPQVAKLGNQRRIVGVGVADAGRTPAQNWYWLPPVSVKMPVRVVTGHALLRLPVDRGDSQVEPPTTCPPG